MLIDLLLNFVRLVLFPFVMLRRVILRRRPTWVHVRLNRPVLELVPAERGLRRWLSWLRPQSIALTHLREVGETFAADASVRGVVIEIPHGLRAGWATLVGLRELIAAWRAQGKRVVAYLPDGGGTREVFLALAADTIWIAPEATLALLGLAGESMYLKPMLDRLGITVEVHAAGRFKTAAEPLVADHMSDAQREQRQALLDGLHAEVISAFRAAGRMDDDALSRAFSAGLLRGAAAVACGLADDVCYADELGPRLAALGSGNKDVASVKPRFLSLAQYQWTFARRAWQPILPAPYIALIPVHGTIGLDASPQGSGANVAALTSAIDAVRRDPRALAAILHIDSPGGSALASDHIHREVSRLALEKPVVAYFGEVAASGGYYVAAPARRIVAQPTTVTGSIGVISAKIVFERLFDQLGVRPQRLKTAAHADMFSLSRRLDDDEHAIMEREAQGLYRTFLGVVAVGRKRPVEEIEALAGGRVWSGRDALAHGLIDRLGGFDVALDEARGLVGVSAVAQRRLKPRIVRTLSQSRMLPRAQDPEALALALLGRFSPSLASFYAAHAHGERLLLLAPWLDPPA